MVIRLGPYSQRAASRGTVVRANFPLANNKALASTLILKLCATMETQ
jgi:hypothetical protein